MWTLSTSLMTIAERVNQLDFGGVGEFTFNSRRVQTNGGNPSNYITMQRSRRSHVEIPWSKFQLGVCFIFMRLKFAVFTVG